jgi:hypothetical protein
MFLIFGKPLYAVNLSILDHREEARWVFGVQIREQSGRFALQTHLLT